MNHSITIKLADFKKFDNIKCRWGKALIIMDVSLGVITKVLW